MRKQTNNIQIDKVAGMLSTTTSQSVHRQLKVLTFVQVEQHWTQQNIDLYQFENWREVGALAPDEIGKGIDMPHKLHRFYNMTVIILCWRCLKQTFAN